MNNRFLQRGKQYDTGEWIYGFLIEFEIDGKQEAFIFNGFKPVDLGAVEYKTIKVDPATVGIFTGKQDKNGKLIFEGDIVRHCGTNPILIFASYELTPLGYAAVFRYQDGTKFTSAGWTNLWEVIGNTHDNPELIKEAK